MQRSNAWQPSATLEVVRERAALLAKVRTFFAARDVLEVDTPMLSHYGVTDVHLENLRTHLTGDPAPYFLQTSPEYAMKRLLAAAAAVSISWGKSFGTMSKARDTIRSSPYWNGIVSVIRPRT